MKLSNEKVSIIIPSYTNKDGLVSCVESIYKHTDLKNLEIIVILNGCEEKSVENCLIFKTKYKNFDFFYSKERLGFSKAINKGLMIKKDSDFFVLLNDDCILLEQQKNKWLELLIQPFLNSKNVGVTGPLKSFCPHADKEFILFFCACISKDSLEKNGPLNETYGLGGGEDTEYCIKSVQNGLKIQQVSSDGSGTKCEKDFHTGNFPIYHEGGKTVKNISEYKEQFDKNSEKLRTEFGYGGDSYKDLREESIEWLIKKYPEKDNRVLDVGAGSGTYSYLLNEYYSVIDAIEAWEPNIIGNKLIDKYDNVIFKEVQSFDFNSNKYDIVIMGDILEHLSVEESSLVLERIIKSGAKDVLIHVPWMYEQGELYGNKYEIHKQPDLSPEIMEKRYPELVPIFMNERKGVYSLKKNFTVTACISTKDRYGTTLPLTLLSIINQTVKPNHIIIFEDSEPLDLSTIPVYKNLIQNMFNNGINFEIIFGEKKGQVLNHQKSIVYCQTDLIWRLDDDVCPEPNVLEELLKDIRDEDVGACASLILEPLFIVKKDKPDETEASIQGCLNNLPNPQWFLYKDDKNFEVEHLHCSFLFKKKAGSHGYCTHLSPVGHREETLFTYEMFKKDWKLIVNPRVKTWHYKNPEGGIRSYDKKEFWEHDEFLFREKIKHINGPKVKEIVLDNGRGDHVAFLSIVPELIDKFGELKIYCCFPDIFESYSKNIGIGSIEEAIIKIGNVEQYNIYSYMYSKRWDKNIIEAFREMYL